MGVHHAAVRRAGAVRAALCALACGLVLTGCASPGGGASTHNDVSRCAAVLPMARDLVHGQGRLVLVRPLRPADADTIARDAGRPAVASSAGPSTAAGPGHRPQGQHPPGGHPGTPGRTPRLCLVAYQGTFRADAIAGAQPAGATGTYAMIFLWVRHPAVDRILITEVLPASSRRPWWHF